MKNYIKSKEFHKKSFEIRLYYYGENNEDTAVSYDNLGYIYEKNKKNHGENHGSTATSYHNLGLLYENMGDLAKAVKFHLKSLKINQNIYGENHSDTALSYQNLGLLYQNMGIILQAEVKLFISLKIRRNLYGENHPDTALSYSHLGLLNMNIRKLAKAEEYFCQSLNIRLNIFGENHEDTLMSYQNLEILQKLQNRAKSPFFQEKTKDFYKERIISFLKEKNIKIIESSEMLFSRKSILTKNENWRVFKGSYHKREVIIKEYFKYNIYDPYQDETILDILIELINNLTSDFPINKCYGVNIDETGNIFSVHKLGVKS